MPLPLFSFSGRVDIMARLSQRRLTLVVLTAYLAFTAFFEESFIFTELSHEHNHAGADGCCSICDQIELAQLLFDGLGRIGLAILAADRFIRVKNRVKKPVAMCRAVVTPVSLKVKCNS
jgi:hypothetical protein